MARTRKRVPYDPNTVHDRRATEMSVGIRNHLSVVEVDDPYPLQPGDKIKVARSTRDDPLADLHARHMIDEAQYHAGREFQRHFEAVESGARAIDFTKEAVDGGRNYEGITDARMRSSDMLTIAYEKLGLNGQVIVHEVLVHNLTRKQMAESRGLSGKRWEEYIGMRFRECLDTLALVYGFAMEKRDGRN